MFNTTGSTGLLNGQDHLCFLMTLTNLCNFLCMCSGRLGLSSSFKSLFGLRVLLDLVGVIGSVVVFEVGCVDDWVGIFEEEEAPIAVATAPVNAVFVLMESVGCCSTTGVFTTFVGEVKMVEEGAFLDEVGVDEAATAIFCSVLLTVFLSFSIKAFFLVWGAADDGVSGLIGVIAEAPLSCVLVIMLSFSSEVVGFSC